MSEGGVSTRRTRRRYLDETDDKRFRSLSRRHDLWRQFYTSMLLQDLQHVFPYPRFNEGFRAEALSIGAPTDLDDTLVAALARERRRGRDRDLAEAIRDFGEECAPHLVAFGVAAYELALVSQAGGDAPQSFRLHLIHPYRRWFGRPQHYLVGDGGRRGKWIYLPAPSVVEFRLPRSRRAEVARAVEALSAANTHNVTRSRLMFSTGLPYSFVRHASIERELLARATAAIGWRRRGLFTDEQLEPYRLLRDLRFEGFQAELRELILAGIDTALGRAGKELGFEARIVVHGLPGESDVAREVRRLRDGPGSDVSLQSVLRPFY